MTPSFQKPTLNLSSLQGKKHLDVRALEKLLQVWPDCRNTPEGRRFYNFIAPRADKASRKRIKRVVRAIDSNPLAIPKYESNQGKKKRLKVELEALCKRIVRARDLDENGWGNCNTCGTRSQVLQWCHFISRHNSKILIYTPENTAYGCGRCNGPGQGEYAKFRDWINARMPGRAEALEAYAARNKAFTWTVLALESQKAKLLGIIEKMGI